MKIDRRRFLQLAAALGASACGGSTPAQRTVGEDVAAATPPPTEAGPECSRWSPTGECTGWDGAVYDPYVCTEYDATGECTAFENPSYGNVAAPADECVAWSPTGECTQYGSGGTYDAVAECIGWDATGECVAWDGYAPANECVRFDAVGECIEWG